MKTLQIDFVSDMACPWCAVGLGALEREDERLRGEIELDLHFQPFELNPQMAPEGKDADEHLMRKYSRSKGQLAAARQAISESGAALGFTFDERKPVWNTFDAHRLLHWAGLEGAARQHALKSALLKACHGDVRNVSDPQVLAAVASKAGLDEARARELLKGDEFAEAVRAEEARWQGPGITSYPRW